MHRLLAGFVGMPNHSQRDLGFTADLLEILWSDASGASAWITLWEQTLVAIWRAAAVIQSTRSFSKKCAGRCTTATPPIATKVCSHRFPQTCEPGTSVGQKRRLRRFRRLLRGLARHADVKGGTTYKYSRNNDCQPFPLPYTMPATCHAACRFVPILKKTK